MKKTTPVLAGLTLLVSVSAAQQVSTQPDPGDAALQVLYHPNSPQTQYLQTHPDAAPLTHAQGQLNFRHTNGTRTAILGSLTHVDATGKWVANEPVLSTTTNGWRLDGTANSLIIRQAGSNHTITQTYTDPATKHDSVLTLTVPTLTYDSNFQLHFLQNGLTWNLLIDPSGTFTFQAGVAARRGPSTYTFPLGSSETLAATAVGGLTGNSHVSLSRAVMIPRVGKTVLCSPWTFAKGQASFTCDDSAFKDEQLPYQIDPASQTITDGGTYNIDSWWDTDQGNGGSDNATVVLNTAGVLPNYATVSSVACTYTVDSSSLWSSYVDDNVGTVSDTISCSNTTFSNSGTTSVTVQINANVFGAFQSEFGQTRSYGDSATIHGVGITVNYVAPSRLPSGLNINGYANSWLNISYTLSDDAGWQNITEYGVASQSMIVNTSIAYSGGCNAYVYGLYFQQLDNSGASLGQHQFGLGSYTTNSSACSMQSTGSAMSYSGCSTGCSGSVTYTIPVYFYTGGTRNIYLNATNGDRQSTGWVNIGTVSVTPSTVSAPSISPPAGTYNAYLSVTLSTATPGAIIRYTTNGTTPSETNGTVYSGAFTVNTTSTVEAIAYESGWYDSAVASATYTMQLLPPTITPPGGAYSAAQSVTLATAVPATIYYTTDGSTPACGTGTVFTGSSIAVAPVVAPITLKAMACYTGWATSAVSSAIYTGAAASPTFSPTAGTYTSTQSVTLSTATSGATLRYTTDGSTPSETNGTLYSGQISLPLNSTTTIKAMAYETSWLDSTVSSGTFTITGTVATPTFSPAGGTYTAAQSVAISSSTVGATVRYTIDGTTPTETHGTVYSGPVTVSSPLTLRAIAYKSSWIDSGIASAAYYFTNPTGGTGAGGSSSGTPPADSGNGLDPRRIGVRALGSYWGAAGEQIDTTSGNLNFTLPLLKAMGRGGWSVGASLNYNSQMWRSDAAGSWLMGYDVGYGLGWRLQIGSLVPIWGSSAIDHYLFIDSTGAEYGLTVNNGGVWTSQEGIYLSYDSNSNRVYQRDGSFWVMGSQSSGSEQDAGTLYPTLIQDSNGNQIAIQYAPGLGAGGAANTSARIQSISDARAPVYPSSFTYSFIYNSDPVPHLQTILGQPGENYTFSYGTAALQSPVDGTSYGSTSVLQAVVPTYFCPTCSTAPQYTFTYAGSGEILSMSTPLGGSLSWVYQTFTYAGNIRLREVQTRSMAASFNNSWQFSHDSASNPPYHATTTLLDNGTGTQKVYTVSMPLSNFVLPLTYEEWNANSAVTFHKDFAYSQSNGNTYASAVTTTLDPADANMKSMSVQTLDSNGNLTQSQAYDYGNLTTPARTYNYTYVTDPNYVNLHIQNRLASASVTANTVTTPLVSIGYDQSYLGPLQAPSGQLYQHDSTRDVNFLYRGNPTTVVRFGDIYHGTYTAYQITGIPYQAKDGAGNTVNITASSSTDYSLPGIFSPSGNSNLATSVTYASSFAVTSVTGPNGATFSTNYDTFGRPQNSTSSDGAVTNYTYSYNPNLQTATISTTTNGTTTTQWKKTYLDGFGRVITEQSGHDTTTVSQVDTQYAPCACSPLGKLWRVSLPHDPNASATWTTYAYDGSGRTLSVTKPDGSVTTYAYAGNVTTVTDPASKWKKSTTDSFGNLIAVTEPDPNNQGGTLATNYTYTVLNQLFQVTMPRSNGTQTRTFTWSGSDLASATNPENGTVTYQYDGAHHVTLRTDAKGQQTQYTYDPYGRLTLVQHFTPVVNGYPQEQPAQDVNYYYDTNPFDANFSQNAWGRLTAVTFGGTMNFYYGTIGTGGNGTDYYMTLAPSYMYSYNQPGRVTAQRMRVVQGYTGASNVTNDFEADYTWDNQGRMTSRTGPDAGYTYTYDAMGRLNGLSQAGATIASAQYNLAGRISSMTYDSFTESRTYNSLMQLTGLVATSTGGTVMNMQYLYSTGQNNGRISQSVDGVVGETVTYTYDALNRLATAGATGGTWGQQYTYDGFGNLTGMQGTAVWSFDPTTNRPSGTSYDANGNPTGAGQGWDVENRLVSTGLNPQNLYGYDASGKRVVQVIGTSAGAHLTPQVMGAFYSISGQKLATIQCTASLSPNNNTAPICALKTSNLYFGGKLIRSNGVTVATDRLGSVRGNANGERMAYLPYGQERTSTADGREKFGTYFRDGPGQDYADQRYYNQAGSFFSPDPLGFKTADPKMPLSWNRYAYVSGDPINHADPTGMAECDPDLSSSNPCPALAAGGDGGYGTGAISACTLDGTPVSCSMIHADAVGPQPKDYTPDSPDPNCVQDAIGAAAVGVGLDLSSFTNIGVQIVGTSNLNGGKYGETELNLSGGDVQGLINAMCAAGFYSNNQCSSNNTPLVGGPHTAPDGTSFSGNFRSPGLTNSVQVNTNVQTGQVQIDVDAYNPAAYPIFGAILHGVLQVLPNKITGNDNTYGCVH